MSITTYKLHNDTNSLYIAHKTGCRGLQGDRMNVPTECESFDTVDEFEAEYAEEIEFEEIKIHACVK